MANVTLGPVRDLWKRISDWVSGATADKPAVTAYGSDDGGATRRALATNASGQLIVAPEAGLATEAQQDLAKEVLDTISIAVAARATEQTLAQIKGALTDGSTKVQLSGSLLERYGATEAQRPAANSVPVGAVYMAVQTQQMWQSDGSQWVVM